MNAQDRVLGSVPVASGPCSLKSPESWMARWYTDHNNSVSFLQNIQEIVVFNLVVETYVYTEFTT